MSSTSRATISSLAADFVGAFRQTRGKWQVAQALTQAESLIVNEYGERFLFELIQNGYDAHGPGDLGAISIVLHADEGPFGTLYVANRGRPFRSENFIALCNPALSSKQPGEGIGNKGVGFRSVVRVCERPEIFSASEPVPRAESFDGFCFTFARDPDIRALCEGDEEAAEELIASVSPRLIPVPIDAQAESIRHFARQGFATVVRLPIDSADGRQVVEKQLDIVLSSPAPILLFLEQLESLRIEIRDTGESRLTELRRTAAVLEQTGDDSLSTVDLSNHGRYLVATHRILSERLHGAIVGGIQAGELDKSWASWASDGHVGIALPLDSDDEAGHLYTYLPMGIQAVAPLAGHLNAPFFSKLARTELDLTISYNAMLVREAVGLSARVASRLRTSPYPFRRRAVVDLLCWRPPYVSDLVSEFRDRTEELSRADLVPALPNENSWSSLSEVRRWNAAPLKILSAERLVRVAGARLVDEGLGEQRIQRIGALQQELGLPGLSPSSDLVAGWIEKTAAWLHRQPFDVDNWNTFYDDLEPALGTQGAALQGRAILICGDGRLRRAQAAGDQRNLASVFFPPVRQRAEDEEELEGEIDTGLTNRLRRRLAFLHPDLEWHLAVPSRPRKPSREFLQRYRLVRPYATRDLLEHIQGLLAKARPEDPIFPEALQWVYRLQLAAKHDQRPGLDELGLRVPTAGGWKPAGETVFSERWPETSGSLVEQLIEETRDVSEELAGLDHKLIVAPAAWPSNIDDTSSWVRYLRRVGVVDGLRPQAAEPADIRQQGDHWRGGNLASHLDLSAEDLAAWLAEAEPVRRGQYFRPYTPYRVQGHFWRLPGSSDYPRFSERARSTFARLVFGLLGQLGGEALAVSLVLDRHYADESNVWPTPLAAFLRQTPWLPLTRPGDRRAEDYVRPDDAWHFRESASAERVPPFASVLPLDLRRELDRSPELLAAIRKLGLRTWNDASDAGQLLAHLGDLLAYGEIPPVHHLELRNLYRETWTVLARRNPEKPVSIAEMRHLIVSRGGALVAAAVPSQSDGPAKVYVKDREDGLGERLLGASGHAIVETDPRWADRISAAVQSLDGFDVAGTSEVDVELVVDGAPYLRGADDRPLLGPDFNWLVTLVTLVAQLRATQFVRRGPQAQRELVTRLRRTTVRWASAISMRLDGEDVALPAFLEDAIAVPDPVAPSIVIKGSPGVLDWRTLETLAPAIAEILGSPALEDPLARTFVQLARTHDEPEEPDAEELARLFGVPPERILELRRGLHGSIAIILDALQPVVLVCAGMDAAMAFSVENEKLLTIEDLITSLASIEALLPIEPAKLVEICGRVTSMGNVRDELHLNFRDFNKALRELGRPALLNRDGHKQAVDYYRSQHRLEILRALRLRFASAFASGDSLDAYLSSRDLEGIRADPAWLEECDTPTDGMIVTAVQAWLESHGGAVVPDAELAIDVEAVRVENRQVLRELLVESGPVVRAWSVRHGAALPDLWTAAPLDVLSGPLGRAPWLDFTRLVAGSVIEWLDRAGAWPTGMPLSVNLEDLDISGTEVEVERLREAEESRQRDEETRRIELGGRPVRATENDYGEIAEIVGERLPDAFGSRRQGFVDLRDLPDARPGTGGRPPGGKKTRRLSEVQLKGIGFAGEVIALRWLNAQYSGTGPEIWKSDYRRFLYGGDLGDDGLGYDFAVPQQRRTLYFEVKASLGRDNQIQLNESEVNRAHELSRTDQYQILWIPNLASVGPVRVYRLRNPFAEKARGQYRVVGRGLRYRFQLPE